MTRHSGDPEDDAAAFAEAVRGTRKLGGARRVSPGLGIVDPVAARQVRRSHSAVAPLLAPLSVDEAGDTWTARADGVDRRVLRKLRAGDIPLEGRLDLHGLTRGKAAEALERFVSASRTAGRRCLLVIHGRGLHSGQDGPALRDVVRELLTTGNHASVVLACTSAPPSQGGAGATLVYLRR